MSKVNYPEWFDDSYFETILRTFLEDPGLVVHDSKVAYCCDEDAGFVSTLYRVEITYLTNRAVKIHSLIVKVPSVNEKLNDIVGVDAYDVQNKEMEFFEKVAPEFKRILKLIGEDENVFPEVIAVDRVNESIVFEDLAVRKFFMADNKKRLDVDHIKKALQKLAKMHAASLVVYENNPNAFDYFDTGMFSRRIHAFNGFYETTFQVLIDEMKAWKGYEHYAMKLDKIKGSMIENGLRAFDCDAGDFHVLNHGDVRGNNIMFNYAENGKLNDAILVSFK